MMTHYTHYLYIRERIARCIAVIAIAALQCICGTALAQQDAQSMAMPYYRNFSAQEYNGHNRNFDVECDGMGRVIVANFEGLLVYDNVSWQMHHSPGISRVTKLYKDHTGQIWFGGYNLLGYIDRECKDSVSVHYVACDTVRNTAFDEVSDIYESDGRLCFATITNKTYEVVGGKVKGSKVAPPLSLNSLWTWQGHEVNDSLHIGKTKMYLATASNGIVVTDRNGRCVYDFNESEGLCSKNVKAISYDGKGTIWGVTDNGIFHLSTSPAYTHYGVMEGLNGMVSTIYTRGKSLYVGTLQGLFRLNNGHFIRIDGINQACWQLCEMRNGELLAATADGVFIVGNSLRQITPRHSISLLVLNESTFLSGELDGIYRCNLNGASERIDNAANVTQMVQEKNGGIWAINLNGETLYMQPGATKFIKKDNPEMSLLLNYTDDQGHRWTPGKTGIGMVSEGLPENLNNWMRPLQSLFIQVMNLKDGVAWLGGNFGLIRFDVHYSLDTKPHEPKLYIRSVKQDGRTVTITFANDKIDPIGTTQYSYRLSDSEQWSAWSESQKLVLPNLFYGSYKITVRSRDAMGQVVQSEPVSIRIPWPIFLHWYSFIVYIGIIALIIYLSFRIHTLRMIRKQRALEAIVNERTKELRDAHEQLIRQEREATIGKLTKGLIDRILNPMNYINNFSHLTLGLNKDLQQNLDDMQDVFSDCVSEDEKESKDEMTDLYDDSADVLDMMKTNLEKIEQHGLSTTRILKAMEEMLKERSTTMQETDISALVQQNCEMVHNYYEADIKQLGIKVDWQRPQTPVSAMINADGISKTVMSVIANSIYAMKKKAEKQAYSADGIMPTLSIALNDAGSKVQIIITDNGIGIEESIQDKVFDPFFTTKPTAEAPGVGLYLCMQIVQDHNGKIEIESQKDSHTTVTITIPKNLNS